jgi:hypothetical protein
MCVTENIIWNENDLERAEAANIRVVTENELSYFETFIAHIGSAGPPHHLLCFTFDNKDRFIVLCKYINLLNAFRAIVPLESQFEVLPT